jgi:hypothetical protein
MLLIGIYQHIYEVSKYISKHPGEGISNTYLREHNSTEATDSFERFHMTNEPDEMLMLARQEGYHPEMGIYWVCPYFFTNKIPKYFYFSADDPYGEAKIRQTGPQTYLLRRSNAEPSSSLSLTYQTESGKIRHHRFGLENQVWMVLWEDDTGETVTVTSGRVDKLVKTLMEPLGYQPIITK